MVGDNKKQNNKTSWFQGLPQPSAQVELSYKLGLRLTKMVDSYNAFNGCDGFYDFNGCNGFDDYDG